MIAELGLWQRFCYSIANLLILRTLNLRYQIRKPLHNKLSSATIVNFQNKQ